MQTDDNLEGLLADLEQENRLLRTRNERLQRCIDGIVPRLEAACGAQSMPPKVAQKFIEEHSA